MLTCCTFVYSVINSTSNKQKVFSHRGYIPYLQSLDFSKPPRLTVYKIDSRVNI